MMSAHNNMPEMINYAEILKEGFNPSSIEDLHALLYLIYFDYQYGKFSDPTFSENLMSLIERCKAMHVMNESCGCAVPQFNECEPCNCPPSEFEPDKEGILDLIQFGVRNLFYEDDHRIPVDIFGREMRRM